MADNRKVTGKTGNKVPENKVPENKVPFDPKSLLGKVVTEKVEVPVPAQAGGNGRGNDIPAEVKRNVMELSRRFFHDEGNGMDVKVWIPEVIKVETESEELDTEGKKVKIMVDKHLDAFQSFEMHQGISFERACKNAEQDPQTYKTGSREIAQYHSRMLGSSFLYSHGAYRVEEQEGTKYIYLRIYADGLYSLEYPARQAKKGWTTDMIEESMLSKFRSGYIYQNGWQVIQAMLPELFQEMKKFYKPRNK